MSIFPIYLKGRTALHIAVLKEQEEIVHYLATKFKQTLHIGDNVSTPNPTCAYRLKKNI